MQKKNAPKPLFDTLENLETSVSVITRYLDSLKIEGIKKEWFLCKEFLKSYAQSKDTFTSYRREIERLLQWCWLIQKKKLKDLHRNDLRDYFAFIQNPPAHWIAHKIVDRFINQQEERAMNPPWRPFVIKIPKNQKNNSLSIKENYQLSSKSVEAVFAILSSLFVYLQQEEYVEINPVALMRQKKAYIQKQQKQRVTRKLSNVQWLYVINTAEAMAKTDKQHERTLFLISALYLLGLRISELAYLEDRTATMGNFAPDKQSLWWYTTVGKGNKMRDVAVPDELLQGLKRYRQSLNLSPLPKRNEDTPLLPKLKGKQGLGTRQIRYLVQKVFDLAIENLKAAGKMDEAEDLAIATVHWLRHTAISSDIENRPREHIRDDVGHENPATMDKYIDIDRIARHQSAKYKSLRPTSKIASSGQTKINE